MTWRSRFVAVLCICSAAYAGNGADHEERLENLERENRALKERVETLESTEEDRQRLLEREIKSVTGDEGLGLNIVIRSGNARGALQIFGDVGFLYSDPPRNGRGNASFFNGSVDFFFTARVGDHFQILSETVFQTKVGSGATGDSSKFDQERLWGAWAFNDSIQVKFGLEHSPISLWNRLYHHGRWLELTIARPLLTNFEAGSGILPMHEAGVEFLGNIPLDRGSLQYIVFISNGRGNMPTVVQEFSDRNNDKAFTFGAGYNFDAPQTIFIGLFARTDEIPPDSTDPARLRPIREWIVSLQFLYQGDKIDIISEFVAIDQDDRTSNTSTTSYSGYFQLGYHIDDSWTPYVRLDFREMARGNPFFMPKNRDLDVRDLAFGVRWDFLDNAALKFEFGFGDREQRDGGGTVTTDGYIRFGVQLSFVF